MYKLAINSKKNSNKTFQHEKYVHFITFVKFKPMDVTFFNTFHGYCLLYTYSRHPTQLCQHSYTNVHLNFTLYYHIYCTLHAFTLHENLRKCIYCCLYWRVPCIIPLCKNLFRQPVHWGQSFAWAEDTETGLLSKMTPVHHCIERYWIGDKTINQKWPFPPNFNWPIMYWLTDQLTICRVSFILGLQRNLKWFSSV